MKIHILLKHYCIKTAAKRKYNHLIHHYLGGTFPDREKAAVEEQIDALKFFLENMDFSRLRSDFPELSGVTELPVTLVISQSQDEIIIQYRNKKIKPGWKNKN